jgi:hypothetical protein
MQIARLSIVPIGSETRADYHAIGLPDRNRLCFKKLSSGLPAGQHQQVLRPLPDVVLRQHIALRRGVIDTASGRG